MSGWRPDDTGLSPNLKLFVLGIVLGPPWGTLPAVLTGYFGNPWGRREWIETALKQGQLAGRTPGPLPDILELNEDGSVKANALDKFPYYFSVARTDFVLSVKDGVWPWHEERDKKTWNVKRTLLEEGSRSKAVLRDEY